MSTALQEEASRKLAEYEAIARGELGPLGAAAKKLMNWGVPLLGEFYFFIARDVIGPPPSMLEYMEELRRVIRGERHTMPTEPSYSPKHFGR